MGVEWQTMKRIILISSCVFVFIFSFFLFSGAHSVYADENPVIFCPPGYNNLAVHWISYNSIDAVPQCAWAWPGGSMDQNHPITIGFMVGGEFLPTKLVDNTTLGFYNTFSMQGGYQAEDKVIEDINRRGKFTLKLKDASGYSPQPYDFDATNCVKLSGDGPNKVVFMRGKTWNSTVAEFVAQANGVIGNGFGSVDPYKTYINQFSFYVDLQKHDDSLNILGLSKRDVAAKSLISQTNCNGDLYIFYGNLTYPAYAAFAVPFAFLDDMGVSTAIHESGHAFAKLFDEYIYPSGTTGELWFVENIMNSSIKNCTPHPSWDFRDSTSNKIYGSVTTTGCSYLQSTQIPPKDRVSYYRPSVSSLMNDQRVEPRTNVISCGYIISRIKGEPLDKAHAQIHWSECLEMAKRGTVVMNGLPPVSPTPIITPPPTSSRFQFLANVSDAVLVLLEKIFGKSI